MHPLGPPSTAAPLGPLQYTIDAPMRTVAIDLASIDDEREILASLQRITRDPAFRRGFNVYVDCNHLRRIPSCEELRRLARACARAPRTEVTCRLALIAGWRPIHEAARFFATVVTAPNISLRVFEAWSDARLWFAVTTPDTTESMPWVGPSPILNNLVRRFRAAGA